VKQGKKPEKGGGVAMFQITERDGLAEGKRRRAKEGAKNRPYTSGGESDERNLKEPRHQGVGE